MSKRPKFEIATDTQELKLNLTATSEMRWTNAGATFSRKVVLFHATPALSLVPPMLNIEKALWP